MTKTTSSKHHAQTFQETYESGKDGYSQDVQQPDRELQLEKICIVFVMEQYLECCICLSIYIYTYAPNPKAKIVLSCKKLDTINSNANSISIGLGIRGYGLKISKTKVSSVYSEYS